MVCYFDVELQVANALLRFLKVLRFEKYVTVDTGSKRFAANLKIQKQPPEEFYEKSYSLKFAKFTGKHLYECLFFNKVAGDACNFIKKETLAQVFSCEFCEISKNNVFTEHLQTSASKDTGITSVRKIFENNKMGSDSFQLTSFDPFARSI